MATFKLVPDTGEVSGSNSNMPLLLTPSATEIGALTAAEADSIRCYTDSSLTTEIAREVVSSDEIHIKIPTVSSATEIWVDYDGVRADYAVGATYGAQNVWSDYEFVSHDGGVTDSAGNVTPTNNGTVSVTGKVGTGADLEAADLDHINLGTTISIGSATDKTISYWFNQESTPGTFSFMLDSESGRLVIASRSTADGVSSRIGFFDGAWRNYGDHSFTNGVWGLAHQTFEGTTSELYFDGSSLGTSAYTQQAIGGTTRLGGRYIAGEVHNVDGIVDEFRIRASALSSNWITTEYNNQVDNGAFWVATEVVVTSTTYKLVPATGEVSGSNSNMPLVLIPSATEIGAITSAEADSIRCYTDASLTTEIAREVVSADEIHIKVPTVSSATEIWVDYDGVRSDYAVTATFGRNNVWTDYLAVYHMGDLTSSTILDSTGNGVTGTKTASGDPTEVTGIIGEAQSFDGATDEYITTTTGAEVGGSDFTVSLFYKSSGTTSADGLLVLGDVSPDLIDIRLDGRAGREYITTRIFAGGTDYNENLTGITDPFDGFWHQLVLKRDGDTGYSYFDGGLEDGSPVTGTSTYTGSWYIGSLETTPSRVPDADIDEVRIRASALSADWITTEYNNQVDNGAFWVATVAGGGGGDVFVPIISMIN